MTLIRIEKNWDFPNLFRQTPGRTGIWKDYSFTFEPVECCDYVVVLNQPKKDSQVRCPPEHVWAIMQEPPNENFGKNHWGSREYAHVYPSDPKIEGTRYFHSQPALPWHVNRDFDFLEKCNVPGKIKDLSWITSNITAFHGQRKRMNFLKNLCNQVDFDLYGRGFNYIEDKWDGLAPYHYSIVVENFSNEYYWSEKIADCFLSWTMPIYYGCTKINNYFPPESLVCIDIDNPNTIDQIKSVVSTNKWLENLDAIAEARQLILEKYQFFPFVANEIERHAIECQESQAWQPINMLANPKTLEPFFRKVSRESIALKKPYSKEPSFIIEKSTLRWLR